MSNREFTVADEYRYNRRSALRWIASHVWRHKPFLAAAVLTLVASNALTAAVPALTGVAFNEVLADGSRSRLALIALVILGMVVTRGLIDVAGRFTSEVVGKRLSRDARDELALNLLGKSQTFHNRQRVGDLMARATNDVTLLADMIVPGMDLILDSMIAVVMPLIFIGLIDPQLLLAPSLFVVAFLLALRDYTRRLNPIAGAMRGQFGAMNADLAETVTGIEVVKSTAQEQRERDKFERAARGYRDLFVANGRIQAFYLPPLLLAVAMAGALLHGVWLVSSDQLSIGSLVGYMGLVALLAFPTQISLWTFNLVQLGVAAADRILALLREETELDENAAGHDAPIAGRIEFQRVSFSYGGTPVLRDVSFTVEPGQTVALVGQTGSGKSTLTKLVNRIYDVDAGRILVDGVDVRDWSLDALRAQVSIIEQDIFLFSRTIRENIAFSLGQQAEQAAVEAAAKDAQAHGFITSFHDGYNTVIGERGVTLSGGQRQRLAIARALITDPRILVLDDSTSAIDSATEDEIQKAIRRVLQGRTTLLITHRLSQIRWADTIIVIRRGEIVDQGTHDELLKRCGLYRRMFAPYREAISRQLSAVSPSLTAPDTKVIANGHAAHDPAPPEPALAPGLELTADS